MLINISRESLSILESHSKMWNNVTDSFSYMLQQLVPERFKSQMFQQNFVCTIEGGMSSC